jgi:type II secretory pathway predicted ATPase ExeA
MVEMFESHFAMSHTPFTNRIPANNLYLSKCHNEILGRLVYAATDNRFAVLTAPVGAGKSTLCRKFVSALDPERHTVLYLSDSKLTPRWFYKGLLEQLGVESKFYRGDARRQLHKALGEITDNYKRTVTVIVDEAHLLERETLEEIRFALNTDMDSANPMSLVLVGQSELWDRLRMQAFAAIRGRIDIKCEITPMDRSELSCYINSHLDYAGAGRDVFSEDAEDAIYHYSAGYARAINKAATHCLMHAAQIGKRLIDGSMAKRVIEAELP